MHIKVTDEAFPGMNEFSIPNLKNLTLRSCQISDRAILVLARYCPKITTLYLQGCRGITSWGMTRMAQKCKDLEILDISYCRGLTDESIVKIAENCKNLKLLTMPGCLNKTNLAMKYLGMNCIMLEKLDISENLNIDFSTVEVIVKNCQLLKEMEIYGCRDVTKGDVISLQEIFSGRNVVINDRRGFYDKREEDEDQW